MLALERRGIDCLPRCVKHDPGQWGVGHTAGANTESGEPLPGAGQDILVDPRHFKVLPAGLLGCKVEGGAFELLPGTCGASTYHGGSPKRGWRAGRPGRSGPTPGCGWQRGAFTLSIGFTRNRPRGRAGNEELRHSSPAIASIRGMPAHSMALTADGR